MEKPQETPNDALWTEVACATFAYAEERYSQRPSEMYIIKHKRSNEYFSYGHWTFEATEAQAFRSSVTAMAVAEQCGLRNVELVQQPVAVQPQTLRFRAW